MEDFMTARFFSRKLVHLTLAAGLLAPVSSLLSAHDVAGDPTSAARKPASMEAVSKEMADAATALWNALTPEQQKKASYEFGNEERLNWHFIPRVRNGLPYKEMTPAQRNLAWAFLSTGMSSHGMMKAQQIMSLEAVLKEMEKDNPKAPNRDPEQYFFTIFGKPDAKGTWGWRIEGHHFAANFTIVDGKAISATPTFMGDNPGEVREGPRKGLRVLATEEDLGRQLVKSLDDAQKKKAIVVGDAPKEIVTAAEKKIDMAKATASGPGLPASEMKPEQRELLLSLIEEYARRHRAELADQDVRKIHVAGFDKVAFVWMGGTEVGQPHYYRIVGPTFLIEYDNTQNNANHIHSVWRDPANDFGEDLLQKHLKEDHGAK
jgi:hypothetical protein